jgi:hypothetical protein
MGAVSALLGAGVGPKALVVLGLPGDAGGVLEAGFVDVVAVACAVVLGAVGVAGALGAAEPSGVVVVPVVPAVTLGLGVLGVTAFAAGAGVVVVRLGLVGAFGDVTLGAMVVDELGAFEAGVSELAGAVLGPLNGLGFGEAAAP